MIKMIQKLKNKKGFTLVELIVVIAIIAILTAVIVPLIARYSAQAQYTTLQDAAQTISNSANNALSDGNQISAISVTEIYGIKESGTLVVTVDKSVATSQADGTAKITSTSTPAGTDRVAERLCASLATTLPENACFYVAVASSAVSGVIYAADNTTLVDEDKTKEIDVFEAEGDFDNAYSTAASGGTAIGVSGKYLIASDDD